MIKSNCDKMDKDVTEEVMLAKASYQKNIKCFTTLKTQRIKCQKLIQTQKGIRKILLHDMSHNEKRLKTSDATLDKIFTKECNTFILNVSNV